MSSADQYQRMTLVSSPYTSIVRQGYRRLAWSILAIFSLLSARQLLIEKNFHYPFQLYLHQIGATAILALAFHVWQRTTEESEELVRDDRSSLGGTFIVVSAHCFAAISMFCTLQSILHFTNLPVLVMLSTTCFLVEGLILYVAGFSIQSRAELCRLSLLVPCCAGVLITEYRLGVPNLTASLLTVLSGGIANALRKLAIRHHPQALANRSAEHRWLVIISSAVAVVSIWTLNPWEREHMIVKVNTEHVPLLVLNAFSTAGALLLGNSILFPMDSPTDETSSGECDDSLQIGHGVWTLLAYTGLVGCYMTLVLRRSYTDQYQTGCFLLAALCIGSKNIYSRGWSSSKRVWGTRGAYEILLTRSRPQSIDTESAPVLQEELQMEAGPIRNSTRGISIRTVTIGILMGSLWTAYLCLNAREPDHPRISANFDRAYNSTVPIEIVLSMYKESEKEVAHLITSLRGIPHLSKAQVTIYTKDQEANEEHVKLETNANKVVKLPNVGREGETYLNHIVNQWDNLATETMFLQADVHNPREFYTRLNRFYRPHQAGYFSLGWVGRVCDMDDCGDSFSWQDDTHLFPEIQRRISNTTTYEHALLNYKGQFVVSAKRIRGIDKSIYYDLWQAFVDPKSWAHQQEYLKGREDSMSRPFFGYTMERIWGLLFQCNDMNIAWKCPSMLSTWRYGGDMRDCQCYDY